MLAQWLERSGQVYQDHTAVALGKIVYGGGPMYLADVKKAREAFPGRLTQISGKVNVPCPSACYQPQSLKI